MSQSLDRRSNLEHYKSRADLPKSGFNLGYVSHAGNLVIGRLHPISYQHVMGGSKISGSNAARITFHDLVTPAMSPASVFIHNFYCTHRSVNTDWVDMFNPSERNRMSADLKNPMFDMRSIINVVAFQFLELLGSGWSFRGNVFALTDAHWRSMASWQSYLYQHMPVTFRNTYCLDAVYDLQPKLFAVAPISTGSSDISITLEQFVALAKVWFDFWCGEGSLLDFFGYPVVNHATVDLLRKTSSGNWLDMFQSATVAEFFIQQQGGTPENPILVNEYPLRHMYAIWYEYYRKPDVEKVSSTLPDYRRWSSVPLLDDSASLWDNCYLLVTRCRAWGSDMFNTALVDGLYRHVYSPIIGAVSNASYASPTIAPSGALGTKQGELLSSIRVSYYDNQTGTTRTVDCPVPNGAARLDAAYSLGVNVNDAALDLKTLQRAESISRYLTRVDLGDEYRDYMANQFGSVIEDYRINRPMLIGSSADEINISQQLAQAGSTPTDTDESGAFLKRQVVASANTNASDGFSLFCSEHGMVISIMSVMPLPQYDCEDPHNFIERLMDYPHPLLAFGMEETMNRNEMSRCLNHDNQAFGHVPYAHAWKKRANEVHGSYLSERWDNCFTRFFGADANSRPTLNSNYLHCHPVLPMFADSILLDGQFYATFEHNFLVEAPLPSDVETV